MTMPDERIRATKYAQEFLRDLMDPSITPRVPKIIREMARRVLKHYPSQYEFERAHRADPNTWGKPEEVKYENYTDYAASRAELYRVRGHSSKKRSHKGRR